MEISSSLIVELFNPDVELDPMIYCCFKYI